MRRGRWVAWSKPAIGQWKINTDGSKKENHTSGGGVIRNEKGDLVYGFSHPYTHSEILHAQLQAIIDGLIYSHTLGLDNVIIETNSEVAAQMIQKIKPAQWSCLYLLRQIWSMEDGYQGISWIFREQNKVADLLAKMAHTALSRSDYHRLQDLPVVIWKCIVYDMIGFPVFRSACN